jgi:hypothetical protein
VALPPSAMARPLRLFIFPSTATYAGCFVVSVRDDAVLVGNSRHVEEGHLLSAMAVVCTNLLAHQARLLADMIETLPVSLAPGHQHERCLELVDQLAAALEELPTAALS